MRTNTRESNFELLRIIAMLMVISVHYIRYGGFLKGTEVFSMNFYLSNLIQSFSTFSVPLYIVISAYFMCDKDFKLRKIINIWLQVTFYTIAIFLILYFLGIIDFNIINFIKCFMPIITNQYGFVTSYIILLILSPFLNKVINRFDKEELKCLVYTITIIFIILGSGIPMNVVTSSYVGLLIVIYFISAYIKRYVNINNNHKKFILVYIFSALSIFMGRMIMYKLGVGAYADVFLAYNSTFVMLGTIGLFMYIRSISIKSKLINNISKLTFGVYLIHDNNYIRPILYSRILNTSKYYNSKYFLAIAIVTIILIFIICAFIEYIRNYVFGKLNLENKFLYITDKYRNRNRNT